MLSSMATGWHTCFLNRDLLRMQFMESHLQANQCEHFTWRSGRWCLIQSGLSKRRARWRRWSLKFPFLCLSRGLLTEDGTFRNVYILHVPTMLHILPPSSCPTRERQARWTSKQSLHVTPVTLPVPTSDLALEHRH